MASLNNVLDVLTSTLASGTEYDHILEGRKRTGDKLTWWVYPEAQAVTVDLHLHYKGTNKLINLAAFQSVSCAADEWTPISVDPYIPPGSINCKVTTGGTGPDSLHVVASHLERA